MRNREVTIQQIGVMAHVEDICDREKLVPPVNVHIVDNDQNAYDFEFIPGKSVDLPAIPVFLPLRVKLLDANGEHEQWSLSNLGCLPEWAGQCDEPTGVNVRTEIQEISISIDKRPCTTGCGRI